MTKTFLWLISFLLILSATVVAYWDKNPSIIILSILFVFLGIVLISILNWKKDLQNLIAIFLLFFLVYLLYSSLIHFGLTSFYGIENIEKDEIYFYTASNDIYIKLKDGYTFWELSAIHKYRETIGAVYWSGLVATVANLYGENSVFAQKISIIFIASLIPVTIYSISRLYFLERESIYISIIYGFFSFVLFLSSIILRDLHVALMFIITIYIVLQRISILNVIILFFVITFSYFLREETGVFMLLFLAIYFIVFINRVVADKYIKYFIYLIFIAIGIAFILNSGYINLFDRMFGNTIERAEELTSTGSMGAVIAKLPFGLNYISLFGFSQIQPFPPSWIFQTSDKGWFGFSYLIAGISWFIGWGFLLYGIVKRKILNRIDFKLVLMLFISLIYLFLMSVLEFNQRRQMAVYPILYLVMVFSYLDITITQRTKIWVGMVIFYLILVLIINYLKL